MKTLYPLYDSKNVLKGTCELDNRTEDADNAGGFVIYCHDLNGNIYEVNAWHVERIINFSDASMPRTYGRLK